MERVIRRYRYVLLAIALALLAGCSSGQGAGSPAGQAGGKTRVAVVVKALNSDYWKIVESGAKEAGKKLNVDVTVLGPNAETDVTGQVAILEDQVVKKVHALVVAPSQPASAIPTFDKAKTAKIPVVLIDTDANWNDKVAFVGTGNFQGGKLAGEFLAKKLGKGARIAVIRGQQGDPTHDARQNGAVEVLKAQGLEVVSIQPANSEREKGLSVMENILQANPDVKGVFCTNDEMCLGAVRAIEAQRKQVVTVGFDGSPDALTSIKDGKLTASVAQSPFNIGYKGVEVALAALKGQTVDKIVDTGTSVIDSTNVAKAEDDLKKILGR